MIGSKGRMTKDGIRIYEDVGFAVPAVGKSWGFATKRYARAIG